MARENIGQKAALNRISVCDVSISVRVVSMYFTVPQVVQAYFILKNCQEEDNPLWKSWPFSSLSMLRPMHKETRSPNGQKDQSFSADLISVSVFNC